MWSLIYTNTMILNINTLKVILESFISVRKKMGIGFITSQMIRETGKKLINFQISRLNFKIKTVIIIFWVTI